MRSTVKRGRLLGVVLGLGVLGLGARTAAADRHEDEQLGYSLVVPQAYRAIPISGAERYIVARWQSEKEYVDKEGMTHRPEIKVILFDPKGQKSREAKERADGIVEIHFENPYRTYEDWLKSDESGGRYVSKKEETTVNGVPTTWYEVAYEKLTTPRHGLAFVYHADDIDYCVTTEVLQQHWDKLSPGLLQAFRSFKVFPRKGTVKREVTESDDIVITRDTSRMTPEERYDVRKERFERSFRIAKERLTEGWYVKTGKNYAVIAHCSEKYAAVVLEQAEAVRAWLDANLSFFGDGLPAPEIIRVCKDWEEERAFHDTSQRSNGSSWSSEITISQNEGFWGFGNVADAIFDRWLADKAPRLVWGMPPWLRNGLSEWMRSAYVKAGRLVFRPDGDLIVALKLAAKQKTLILPREMIQISDGEMMEREKAAGTGTNVPGIPIPIPGLSGARTSPWMQAGGLIRYLFDGPGKSDKRAKDLLRTYVTTLDAYVKEEDEKPIAGVAMREAPKTEEEEDARFKERQTFWKDHEKDLLKAVFERGFKDWTDADWQALDKSYRNFAR